MILRSVTNHVKNQNWFAVILDLVIVIFGVFIGIQVSNWNEKQTQEEVTTVLIKRLSDDLNREHQVITAELAYYAVVKKYALKALDGLNKVATLNDEQFVIAAYQASQQSGVWSYRSAYTELIRTGNVNLIKNEKLKDLILGYYASDLKNQNALLTESYVEYIRGIIPFEIQQMIINECSDIVISVAQTFSAALPETCDLQLPDEIFSEAATLLRSQPTLLNKLQFQLASNERYTNNMAQWDKENQKLMTMVIDYQP